MDRRRLKRRLNFWRILAVLVFAAAVFIALRPRLVVNGGIAGGVMGLRPHLARLEVHGLITEDRPRLDQVRALARDPNVRAVILDIDSPGGSVAGGESLHDALADLAAKKPLVAVMDGTAASAAYMIAMPATRVFARGSTLTGSIGVILETGEISGLLDHVGITATAITSGPLKDQPSFTKPLSPQGRDYLHGVVMDLYDQFVGMVAAGRHMDPDRVRELADGRAYTGRQALKLGLIDQLGGEPEARTWLAANAHVPQNLPVSDVKERRGWTRWIGASLGGVIHDAVEAAGLTTLPRGALAIWQGGTAE